MSITTVTDLWRMGATELAEAIRSGQVSGCEVAEAHLRRIEQVNPAVNAVSVVERMRGAGAIPIGHTKLPDFAIGWHTDSQLWGATVNPWERPARPERPGVARPQRWRPARPR